MVDEERGKKQSSFRRLHYRPCELGESVYFGRGQGKMMGYGGYKQKPGTAGICHIDIGFYINKEELRRKPRDGWRLSVGLSWLMPWASRAMCCVGQHQNVLPNLIWCRGIVAEVWVYSQPQVANSRAKAEVWAGSLTSNGESIRDKRLHVFPTSSGKLQLGRRCVWVS